jgi:hypothetical protein
MAKIWNAKMSELKDYITIEKEIDECLEKTAMKFYSDFYIGITDNIEHCLFTKHHVSKDTSWWIYRTAIDDDIARSVENHYLKLGMRGDDKDGNDKGNIVYCYAVSSNTID